MAQDIGSGTAAGLLAFMDFMVSKGYATSGAISPWKSASKQVISTVEGEDFGGTDVRNLDIEEYLDRFETMSLGKYSAESLRAYRGRFRRAMESYRAYLENPNWRPGRRRSTQGSTERPKKGNAARAQRSESKAKGSGVADGATTGTVPTSLITYPFPLKSGQMAQLNLPTQLDREDAERLTHFIRALVLQQPAQLEPAAPEHG